MGFLTYFLVLCILPLATCECEKTLKSNFGDIKFPALLQTKEYCGKFTYNVNNPDKNPIILTFTEFQFPRSTDCEKGYVEVVEDFDVARDSRKRFCGHVLPRPLIVVSGVFKINIILNDNTTQSRLFAEFDECDECVEKITKASGRIQYYLNPEDDTSGTDKLYVIESPAKQHITLVFDDFNLDGSKNCMFEYLQIRDGTTLNSPTIATLCGQIKPNPITIKNGQFTVIFHSEEPYAKHGFSVRFINATQAIPKPFTPTTTATRVVKDENKLPTTDFYFKEATKANHISLNSTSEVIGIVDNNTMDLGKYITPLPIVSRTRERNGIGDSLSKTAITVIGTVASSMLLTFSVVFIILWTRHRRLSRRSSGGGGYGTYHHSISLRGPYDLKKSKEQEVNVIYNANFSDPNPVPKINSTPCVITNIENVDSNTPSVITSVDSNKSPRDSNEAETLGNAGKDLAIEDGLQYSFMLTSNRRSSDENKNSIKGVYSDNINDNKGFYQAV